MFDHYLIEKYKSQSYDDKQRANNKSTPCFLEQAIIESRASIFLIHNFLHKV